MGRKKEEPGIRYRVVPLLTGSRQKKKFAPGGVDSIREYDTEKEALERVEVLRHNRACKRGAWYPSVLILISPCPGLAPSIIHKHIHFPKINPQKNKEIFMDPDALLNTRLQKRRKWQPSTIQAASFTKWKKRSEIRKLDSEE